MTRNLPTKITAEYEKLNDSRRNQNRIEGAVWEYHLDCDKYDVSGFAGGLLTRNADRLWIAHYWEHCQGEPAKTREQAILNVLPLAAALAEQHENDQNEYKRIYEERNRQARGLSVLFPPGTGSVIVRDTTAEYHKPSPEARYKVTMTFDNLTYDQVCELAESLRRKQAQ